MSAVDGPIPDYEYVTDDMAATIVTAHEPTPWMAAKVEEIKRHAIVPQDPARSGHIFYHCGQTYASGH